MLSGHPGASHETGAHQGQGELTEPASVSTVKVHVHAELVQGFDGVDRAFLRLAVSIIVFSS